MTGEGSKLLALPLQPRYSGPGEGNDAGRQGLNRGGTNDPLRAVCQLSELAESRS